MTGFSFNGILFTETDNWLNPLKNLKVFLLVFFYVMAVYSLNSFADYKGDIQSQRLKIIGNLAKSTYLTLLILFVVLFSMISISLGIIVFLTSIFSFSLWIVYYLPPFRLKSTFLAGTFAHFVGGILHFHIGYNCYETFDKISIAVATYFALLLCTGHLHHEMIDYEADKNSGNRTTAVRIGLDKIHYLRTLIAATALIYLSTIYYYDFIGKTEFAIFAFPTTGLLIISAILKGNELKSFQKISRNMFLCAGLLLLAVKLYAWM